VSGDDVIIAIQRLPDKSSADYPLPTTYSTWSDMIPPFVVELFNRLLAAGHFPACFKEAFITPVNKKAGLDVADVR